MRITTLQFKTFDNLLKLRSQADGVKHDKAQTYLKQN